MSSICVAVCLDGSWMSNQLFRKPDKLLMLTFLFAKRQEKKCALFRRVLANLPKTFNCKPMPNFVDL
jgi:hypothetical protein